MNATYRLTEPATVFSPSLVFYPDLIRGNIARVIEMAGAPERLRPHVKTHKTREIARMLLDAGVTRHKCATIAEAEMLATVGAPGRADRLPARRPEPRPARRTDPQVSRHVVLRRSSTTPTRRGRSPPRWRRPGSKVGVMLDLDVGQHRTGIAVGDERAGTLRTRARRCRASRPTASSSTTGTTTSRTAPNARAAVREFIAPVLDLRKRAEAKGIAGAATRLRRHAELPGLRGDDRRARASSARPARSCCTTPVTARSTPTSRASRRPRCW